jgi:hypothetical protein
MIRPGIRSLTIVLSLAAVQGLAVAQFRAAGQNDWVSMWALNGQSEQQVAKQLRSEYQMRIKIMDRVCKLEEKQRNKLKLAGEADVTRFLRDVARTRQKVEKLNIDNNNVQEAWDVVSPLATRVQTGLFSDGSLFDKVFRSLLDNSQQQRYDAQLDQDRQRRWRAITRTNVADIEKAMPLLGHQREQLLELLDDVEVPKSLNRHIDGYVGFLRLIKLEDKQLAEFLDEHQLAVINQYRERYQGWAGMFQ